MLNDDYINLKKRQGAAAQSGRHRPAQRLRVLREPLGGGEMLGDHPVSAKKTVSTM